MKPPSHNQAQCHELFARLSEYLDSELDHTVCDHIEHHLHDCPDCRVCLQTLQRTIDLCRHTKTQPLPGEVAERLRQWIAQLE